MVLHSEFNREQNPGGLRILFLGEIHSTHALSWISLLDDQGFNIRAFALPSGVPPSDFTHSTYVTSRLVPHHARTRRKIPIFRRNALALGNAIRPGIYDTYLKRWIAHVVRKWRPNIIHTFGIFPSAVLYLNGRKQYGLDEIGQWIVQVRGGPDLAENRFWPDLHPQIETVLRACDMMIADNELNYQIAREMGLSGNKSCAVGPLPGTGGIDVDVLARAWAGLPSERDRIVVWPKAYEGRQSKGIPVLEGIRLAWNQVRPCRFVFTAVNHELRNQIYQLPREIQDSISMDVRVDRAQLIEAMTRARVVLMPSISDGVPNTLYEAMATGAVPIVSPLPTITPVVQEPDNVLFARNLYPDEIAEQIVKAMTDDDLVDCMAENNVAVVRKFADRKVIGPKVVALYRELAAAV